MTIRIGAQDGGVQVELQGRGQPLRWLVDDSDAWASARKVLTDDLLEFKRLIGNEILVSDWTKEEDAMRFLHEKGRWLGSLLTGGNRRLGASVEEYVRKSCPTWMTDIRPPILIEVQSRPNLVFPIDLLPLFDRMAPSRIKNLEDLWRFSRSFLGFTAVLKRTFSGVPLGQDATLRNDPALPVTLLYDATLAGARKEADYFLSARYFAFERPWPYESARQDDLRQRLVSFLVDPSQGVDGRLDVPNQVLHFACHCDTDWESPERYSIRLASAAGARLTVTMGQLVADLWGSSVPDRDVSLPLVFMNACGTGKIMAGAFSYPKMFLDNGFRGFIGTETRIPDAFAAAFSRRFYRSMVGGLTLGDSIYDAKLHFMSKYNNPLGILYVAYADTDIHVQHPMSKGELSEQPRDDQHPWP